MSKLLCFSVVFLSILLSSAPSRVHSVNPGSPQTQNSKVPQIAELPLDPREDDQREEIENNQGGIVR